MHRSLKYLATIFYAVLAFLLLGSSTSAIAVPEQRQLAKRKPTSTSGEVDPYKARQFVRADAQRVRDCPP